MIERQVDRPMPMPSDSAGCQDFIARLRIIGSIKHSATFGPHCIAGC
jgi:hypothetical protein